MSVRAQRLGAAMLAAMLLAVGCARTEAVDCGACKLVVPGTDIAVPAEYSQGGKLHYTMRVAQFASRQLWAPPAAGGVAMVGDSITEGGDWEALAPGATTVNFGISWDRTTGLLNRLDQIRAARPSKIVLLIGTNDLNGGASPEEVAANTRRVVEALAGIVPAERILMQAVLPRQAEFRGRIEDLNRRLQTIAEEAGAVYFDLYTPFLVGDGLDPATTYDSLHLNEEGYRRWAGLIAAWIRGEE